MKTIGIFVFSLQELYRPVLTDSKTLSSLRYTHTRNGTSFQAEVRSFFVLTYSVDITLHITCCHKQQDNQASWIYFKKCSIGF